LLTPRYRALLGLSGAAAGRAGGKSWGGGAGADGDGDGDDASDGERGGGPGSTAAAKQWGGRQQRESLEMSVTFQPGLDKLGPALLARKAEAKARAGDSVWDAYLRCVCKGGGGGVDGGVQGGWQCGGQHHSPCSMPHSAVTHPRARLATAQHMPTTAQASR
jgi:hypothetical protein